MGCGPSIRRLPDDIITLIVSFTSPADVCRFAAASSVFRTAASSDRVWERFLPDNYDNILDQTKCTMRFTSKKLLYFHFCLPQYVPDDNMYFWLEKSSGKKCYRLCPGKFTASVDSRFFVKPHEYDPIGIQYFSAEAYFDTGKLSPDTTYAAYLLVENFPMNKLSFVRNLLYSPPAELSVKLNGNVVSTRTGCVRVPPANITGAAVRNFLVPRSGDMMEIELGSFYVEGGEEGSLEMGLSETVEPELGKEVRHAEEPEPPLGRVIARGLIIEGFEIRPYVKATYECIRPEPFNKWYDPSSRFV